MTVRSNRSVARRLCSSLCLLALVLAACTPVVVVQNPKTGEAITCSGPMSEWNPWSQSDACVAGHLAQGWTIAR